MSKKASKAIPEGLQSLTPQFWFNGNCRQAIDFYKKALKAEVIGNIADSPDGKSVWHAMLKVGNSCIMLSDAMPDNWERGPQNGATMGVWLYADDCDAIFNSAVKNGCKVIMEMNDMFWGDRMGKVKDPYGHCWAIAARRWDYTPEEMKDKMDEFLAHPPEVHTV